MTAHANGKSLFEFVAPLGVEKFDVVESVLRKSDGGRAVSRYLLGRCPVGTIELNFRRYIQFADRRNRGVAVASGFRPPTQTETD